MYYNVFGEKVSRARYREMIRAQENRRELIAARFTRRDLIKMGLITSGGYLITKRGLSARAASPIPQLQLASPHTTPFIEPMPIIPIKQAETNPLRPAPTVNPNTAEGEARTRPHQALLLFPPQKFYKVRQRPFQGFVSPDLPKQKRWGFDRMSPGPTYVARYGQPILVRNFNDLDDTENEGFGIQETTTHLHNGHTPSESDGFPCDFYPHSMWSDQHYPNVLAGILSTHPGTGDINEALSTLWYHDHRVDFTSQNVYKGLFGFFLLFNEFDTGDETTGFHLPSFPQFDIPIAIEDKVFDQSGRLFFDLFNLDGILGDKFLANGKIQPFFQVHPRRYRLRLLNPGPSRFYEFFLTDSNGATKKFWHIANDGNLLPRPVEVESVRIAPAERNDIIVDFSQFQGQSVFLENRLKQDSGIGPVRPGDPEEFSRRDKVLRFDVVLPTVVDNSQDPSTQEFYSLPDATPQPVVTRTFKFDRINGLWSINGQFMDATGLTGSCVNPRFRIKRNTVEHWILTNRSGNWQHPIHIHFEEHQILARNLKAPPAVERARKDVIRLQQDEVVQLFFRFRDFMGRYPLHCHNTVHEDHAMMLRWDIDDEGDLMRVP